MTKKNMRGKNIAKFTYFLHFVCTESEIRSFSPIFTRDMPQIAEKLHLFIPRAVFLLILQCKLNFSFNMGTQIDHI